MCTPDELAIKLDNMEKSVDTLNISLNGMKSDVDLFKSNVLLINETVSELKKYKSASVLKKMEEDIAVLDLMKEMKENIHRTAIDMATLKQEMTNRPCYVNPGMYSKFMKELSNEVIDTKGRIFLVLDNEGVVKTINHYGCQLIGKPADEIIGKEWIEEFIPDEDKPRINMILSSIINGTMNGYDTVINSIVTSIGKVEIKWKNYIFTDNENPAILIMSLGEKL